MGEGLARARRYLVQQHEAGGADGPTKLYALGENALDEINAEELKGFIDRVRLPRLCPASGVSRQNHCAVAPMGKALTCQAQAAVRA